MRELHAKRLPHEDGVQSIAKRCANWNKASAMIAGTHEIIEQVEQIDQQILKLLIQRADLCKRVGGVSAEDESEQLALWIEEADDNEMDVSKFEKIAKQVILMCRKGDDEE